MKKNVIYSCLEAATQTGAPLRRTMVFFAVVAAGILLGNKSEAQTSAVSWGSVMPLWNVKLFAAAETAAENEDDSQTVRRKTRRTRTASTQTAEAPMSERKRRALERAAARAAAIEKAEAEAAAAEKEQQQLIEEQRLKAEQEEANRDKKERDYQRNEKRSEWVAKNLWQTDYFRDKAGIVYDRDKPGQLSDGQASFGGVLAEIKGKICFLTPLSVLAKIEIPAARLMDGTDLRLIEREPYTMGDCDILAICLGDAPARTQAQQQALDGTDLDASFKEEYRLLQVVPIEENMGSSYMVKVAGINTTAKNQIAFSQWPAELNKENAWLLRVRNSDQDFAGNAIFEPQSGRLIGVLGYGLPDIAGKRGFVASDLTKCDSIEPLQWVDYQHDMKNWGEVFKRTDSFRMIRSGKFSAKDIPDDEIRSIVESTAAKVKVALSKVTPSQRDTTNILKVFKERLSAIAKEEIDVNDFKIPYFRKEAAKHVELRLRYLDHILQYVKDIDFTK